MFVECPHCYKSVLPTKDNLCPACRRSFSDPRDINPNLASLIVSEERSLPPFCFSCNSKTERRVKVQDSIEIGGNPRWQNVLTFILGLFLHLFIIQRQSGKKHSVLVFIPQCETCAKSKGKPTPEHVDFENRTMTFIVHRGFKEKVMTA